MESEPVIERKVTAATIAATLTSAAVYLLAKYVVKGDVPEEAVGVVGVLVTSLVTFVAGYVARHTHR